MPTPNRKLAKCLLAGLLACFTSVGADSLWLAGSEFSPDNSYSYVGTVMPIQGDSFKDGWMQRYWLDWLTYQYESDIDTIKAKAWGTEAAIGYQFSHNKAWGNVFLGAVYRDTDLSPNDPGNDNEGGKLSPKASFQYNYSITDRSQLDLLASYIFNHDAYWSRTRFTYQLENLLYVGPEVIFNGDPDYQIIQLGIFASGIKLTDNINLGIKTGIKMVRDESNHAYIGVELARWF